VARFAADVARRSGGAVVLAGRCFERESIPYRAFDGVVDALSAWLAERPGAAAAALLPAGELLARVFPVLRRVPALAVAPSPAPADLDPIETRSRVFAGFRALFQRIAQHRKVLLLIDDLQWSDPDSIALLREALRPPDAPGVLLVATVRTGTRDPSEPTLGEAASAGPAPHSIAADTRHLRLEPLQPADARALAELLLGGDRGVSAGALAAEARGHPLFIDALVRHARRGAGGSGGPGRPLRLDEALGAAVDRLDERERRILEVVSVASAPISQDSAGRAAEVSPAELAAALASLRAANLLRVTGMRATDLVEPFHDRVRQAVLARFDDATRKARHETLARALAATEASSTCTGSAPATSRRRRAARRSPRPGPRAPSPSTTRPACTARRSTSPPMAARSARRSSTGSAMPSRTRAAGSRRRMPTSPPRAALRARRRSTSGGARPSSSSAAERSRAECPR
jgi:eukaryotic-like serine/threonine-protein kinase